MGCNQTNTFLPNVGLVLRVPNARPGNQHCLSQSSYLHVSLFCASATHRFLHHKALPSVTSASKYKRCTPVCSFGGKGDSGSRGEDFSWDSLKKAMEGLGKQSSLEDRLKKEIEQREFNGDGGGKNPPGDGGDGLGGPEDEGFSAIVEEFLQVIMATISFILVYVYLIRGEELLRLAKDYIKYLFGAQESLRLRRAMYKWRKFKESITWKQPREDWLEHAIVATPTWWHRPAELKELLKTHMVAQPREVWSNES